MTININDNIVVDANRNVIIGSNATDPSGSSSGTLHFNSIVGALRGWDGTQWQTISQGSSTQIWNWGSNFITGGSSGVLTRSGSAYRTSSPISIVGGFTDWTFLAGGNQFQLGLRDSRIWGWGNGGYGRLGNGSTGHQSSPVSVSGGFSDWTFVNSGGTISVGIRSSTGRLYTWGNGYFGAMGINFTTGTNSTPSEVSGGGSWIYASASKFSGSHCVAIRSNGQAWCWGRNHFGQLGNGSNVDRSSPNSVVGGFTDWVQVDAGRYHTAGIRSNGQMWCWGDSREGKLGIPQQGPPVGTSSPRSVVSGFTNWTQVSCGQYFTVGLRSNGQIWTFGRNAHGQLGNYNISNQYIPQSVVGNISDWVQVSAGYSFVGGIRSNGQLWTWGRNHYGQLGDGTTTNRSSPVSVVGGITDWSFVRSGYGHMSGIRRL